MVNNTNQEILAIKNQIAQHFGKSDWLSMGYALDCYDIIENHSRLLRSLDWGDNDYEGNILEVLTSIVRRNPDSLQKINAYLAEKYSANSTADFISTGHKEMPRRMKMFAPSVFQIPDKAQNEKLVAVMLPFKLQETFCSVKSACDNLQLECKKADDIWENAMIIQDIFELIFTCKVVVADFTGKNPNVFYEVGIAHTLGKIVIPITQSLDDVPSDLGHHRALKYLPNLQGYVDLRIEIEKKLKSLFPTQTSSYNDFPSDDLPF